MAPHPTQLKGYLVLIPPKILKALRCQLGVLHRVLNVPMPQVELDGARILVRIGQLIPTRMPERFDIMLHLIDNHCFYMPCQTGLC
jgi:hypothetical protein